MLHFCRTAQSALCRNFQTFDIRRCFCRIDWFSNFNSQFGVSASFLPNIYLFGRIRKFCISALLKDLSKFQTFGIRRNFSWIDWFSNNNTKFYAFRPFSPSFNPFGRIWKCRVSVEQLKQLVCRIYRNFKLLIFVDISAESIDFPIKTLNFVRLGHFHQVLIDMAGF